MILATKLMQAIDRNWQREEEPRNYLGASVMGEECSRALWYGFRWAAQPLFPPRILRLFDRGNREEEVFAELLRQAGVEFYDRDPATNEQYVVTFKNKHLGGHADGVGRNLPDLEPGVHFLGEWKTHNTTSFSDLVKKGVKESKPTHYAQMQLYMLRLDLHWALYGGVCKNDDHLHFELIGRDDAYAATLLERADTVVYSQIPLKRISSNPGWYKCKWCDFYNVCHKDTPMQVNCRTCQHVVPLINGEWWCGQHDKIVDKGEQLAGCQDHVQIHN